MASAKYTKETRGIKRKQQADLQDNNQQKRAKRFHLPKKLNGAAPVTHLLLSQSYAKVQTLRDYIASKLLSSSRLRRKKILFVGRAIEPQKAAPGEIERALCHLLDTTLVGIGEDDEKACSVSWWDQFISLSQKEDESYVTLSDGGTEAPFSQAEIVDRIVWLLFTREKKIGSWPKHVLCDGFRKGLSGVYSFYPNEQVQALKQPPWTHLLALLGKAGERIMGDLLLDNSIFMALEAGRGNYYQLSGVPISELRSRKSVKIGHEMTGSDYPKMSLPERSRSEINFIRARILYARAALSARGTVQLGFRHIHVLNRCPHLSRVSEAQKAAARTPEEIDNKNEENTLKVMMYIFPRQFGLHNVFTSAVNSSQTGHKLQDYTLREEEIARTFGKPDKNGKRATKIHIPKRLRGDARRLVERLQILHGRCSYAELLRHYCPTVLDRAEQIDRSRGSRHPLPTETRRVGAKNQRRFRPPLNAAPVIRINSAVELATSAAQVSAFCQAVLAKIIPNEIWGTGPTQLHNKEAVMKKVDHFIKIRRYESVSLHEVLQDIKISDIDWLVPASLRGKKACQTDTNKRIEVFSEFLYYLFDSLLIPLIRSNFYVTESSVHRNQLFFFRHDVWRYIAEPAMAALKVKMFEEIKLNDAMQILNSRHLGYSTIRLLPKATGMRPITNLKRRIIVKGKQNKLGKSINSVINPIHMMLNLEKDRNPSALGSSLFSVRDLYEPLKAFGTKFGSGKHRFYFAKVDVQSAFDTIPQAAVLRLMREVPHQEQYTITRYGEVSVNEPFITRGGSESIKTSCRWPSLAKAAGDTRAFAEKLEDKLAKKKRNTIFVNSARQEHHATPELLSLMDSHVRQNLVRIGKKYYRQKNGIPQGSALSSTLCSYFYANLERKHLHFLASEDCLLVRMIDDFLLITLDKGKARRFVEVMHRGIPEYGVTVSEHKTLVNFDLSIDGQEVPKIADGECFPYCGMRINCSTLDISKGRDMAKDTMIANTLTVDYGRLPGQNFQRRVLNAFKTQASLMYFDTAHNSLHTVFSNIHDAFSETATKMWAYTRCLPVAKRPRASLIIRTILNLIDVAFTLMTGKTRRMRFPDYICDVDRSQVAWLAFHAFRQVLRRKQSGYGMVTVWLDRELKKLSAKKGTQSARLSRATA